MVRRYRFLHQPRPGQWYVRRGGQYIGAMRSQDGRWLLPNTAEFDAVYWEIMGGKRIAAKTSFNALIENYRRSDDWTRLKPRTRRDYERVLEYLGEKIGPRDVKTLTRAKVIEARDANLHRTRFANYIAQILVVLCEHAINIGWIAHNPAKGVRALKTPPERRKEHVPWPDWAVELFREQASPEARLIFELGVGTVQRPGDWPRFTWGDYDGDRLTLTQGKTGRKLVIPCTERLRQELAAARARLPVAPMPSRPILVKRDGNPMTYDYLSKVMMRERQRLGLEAFDLHALRYRGVKELAWAGCDDDEIASYSGHATKAMIHKFAGEARQEMRARQAREKRR